MGCVEDAEWTMRVEFLACSLIFSSVYSFNHQIPIKCARVPFLLVYVKLVSNRAPRGSSLGVGAFTGYGLVWMCVW